MVVAVVCACVCHLVCETHGLCKIVGRVYFARLQDAKRQQLREFVQRALDDDDVEDVVGDLYTARLRTPAVIAKTTIETLKEVVGHAGDALLATAIAETGACFVPFPC